jgi:hypothetical protein
MFRGFLPSGTLDQFQPCPERVAFHCLGIAKVATGAQRNAVRIDKFLPD